ncbi:MULTISPECIES: Lrp/AsnC family transcriptional regulator [Sulfitobacter]|jgi:DNA-binding Lrp family transcriptional regulator|uniref:HTH-type transcriptional regulator LrpC n=1 Tax=Sulfitobacter dubius TaxID=218673 RepID=A0ABY3ZLD8_9RHOB|nr:MULTISPECIES: Lrp/AsnC family transcriptional regulator [Sulfitobacter]MCZ4365191.1 Lrp/AsnC family transcriptional regulator [Sulfitobacter dubius]UOA13553.1 HTH-type transcriptional regulator LrpC [Sulfitobacter dubius]UWR33851.1 Lrp/AsnC family transcriptional regulator [Sulfitobacter sp. W027]WOI28414.1 Lrp/AsnC family transcriptional regulator [Sulfitobacter dubius]
MDEIDNKIIAELRRDARMSYSALAATTGLSRVTVRARVERLVSSGAILGFTLILKEDMRHSPIRGHTLLAIEGAGTDRIKRILAGMPAVQAIHSTNGKWDLIVETGTETVEELDSVLGQIRRIQGVSSSETNLLLATQMTVTK